MMLITCMIGQSYAQLGLALAMPLTKTIRKVHVTFDNKYRCTCTFKITIFNSTIKVIQYCTYCKWL